MTRCCTSYTSSRSSDNTPPWCCPPAHKLSEGPSFTHVRHQHEIAHRYRRQPPATRALASLLPSGLPAAQNVAVTFLLRLCDPHRLTLDVCGGQRLHQPSLTGVLHQSRKSCPWLTTHHRLERHGANTRPPSRVERPLHSAIIACNVRSTLRLPPLTMPFAESVTET